MLRKFMSLLDITETIDRALMAVQGIRGIPALVMASALMYANWQLLPWLWYFDLQSTAAWMSNLVGNLNSPEAVLAALTGMADWTTVQPGAGAVVGYSATAIFVIPTIVTLFGARFARYGIVIAGWLGLFFMLTDMITDYPRMAEAIEPLRASFYHYPLIGWIGFQFFRTAALFVASCGLEIWFIATTVAAIYLLFIAIMTMREPHMAGGRVKSHQQIIDL